MLPTIGALRPRTGAQATRGVRLQHVAHRRGGHLGAADVDLVGGDPAGDEHAAVDHLDAVTGAQHPVDALAALRRGDEQLAVVDGQRSPGPAISRPSHSCGKPARPSWTAIVAPASLEA